MDTPTSESGDAIEKLLQERSQYEQWLARLAGAGTAAPDAVRQRVRTDYEARLKGVIDELRTHSDTINNDLARFRATQRELETREAEAEERMAEAEVRHAVGEFEESKWSEIREESGGTLTGIRDELAGIRGEIARLAEVQRLIAAPVAAAAPAPAAPPAAPAPPSTPSPMPAPSAPAAAPEEEFEPVLIEADAAPTPAPPVESAPAAPRFVPRAPAPAAAPPGDELAFLKSVTGEAPAAPRVSGGHIAPSESSAIPSAGSGSAKATVPNQAKTLKCHECATLNRPTEWYCERCGAELAAL